ncbi:hypothetical protein BDZ97DRAFT_1766558 [Flammula alnicola]|nr:hypothetical protein BDZ97DRAFT_1766558 [Flammula alnicola]
MSASMAILRDASFYHQQLKTKVQKGKVLNSFVSMLYGKCVMCYAFTNNIVNKHTGGLFIQCKPRGTGYVDYLMGWQVFKRKIQFSEAFKYCFKCGLPQDKQFMPSCHPSLETGNKGNNKCPLEDFVILLVWWIRHEERWWLRACDAFTALQRNWGEDEFAAWLRRTESVDSFYNDVEYYLSIDAEYFNVDADYFNVDVECYFDGDAEYFNVDADDFNLVVECYFDVDAEYVDVDADDFNLVVKCYFDVDAEYVDVDADDFNLVVECYFDVDTDYFDVDVDYYFDVDIDDFNLVVEY